MRVFFQIWLLFALSDAIAGFMAGLYLWRLNGGFARKKALVLFAVALESLLTFFGLLIQPPFIPGCFVVSKVALALTGRSIKAAVIWYVAFYDLGLLRFNGNGKPKE